MKKMLMTVVMVGFSLSALAQQSGLVSSGNGFKGPASGQIGIAQAKNLRDNVKVVIEGNVVKQIGDELYEFRDSSGMINVEIDSNLWNGLSVTPADKVRISGEIDKDWNSVELDAYNIQVLK
ncbi:MAG TPA: YgiW/YdeI family stress tolerance OB fold protein [Scandinavium sp.]|jgi:uncharacterized protein (TIGR00156 family)